MIADLEGDFLRTSVELEGIMDDKNRQYTNTVHILVQCTRYHTGNTQSTKAKEGHDSKFLTKRKMHFDDFNQRENKNDDIQNSMRKTSGEEINIARDMAVCSSSGEIPVG